MNILVLHSSSDLYGASKILLQTVVFLLGQGNHVVVVLSEEGSLAQALRERGVDVHIIKLGILRRKYFNARGLLNRIFAIRKASRKLTDIVDRYGIDIIYSNTTGVLVGALVAKKSRVKHIWHIHEIITQPLWFLKALGWVVNRYSSHVIVVSEAVKGHWQDYIDKNKISVVYNGLCYNDYLIADGSSVRKELGLNDADILVGMIGRVHYWKGQGYFLQIAKHLVNKYPNVKFVMVGDAYPGYEYLYKELEKAKVELGIQNRVMDLGYRKDIPEILAALDIFILPSILPDPLPTVVLEAMAAGKPVVATAQGGALEMVQNRATGYLVPWDNDAETAQKVSELLQSRELRDSMGTKGRERAVALFSEKAYFENVQYILNQTVSTNITSAFHGV